MVIYFHEKLKFFKRATSGKTSPKMARYGEEGYFRYQRVNTNR